MSHSKLMSPSASHKWIPCTAMPQALIDSGIDTSRSGPEAELGTTKHEYAREVFLGLCSRDIPQQFKDMDGGDLEWNEVLVAVDALEAVVAQCSGNIVILTEFEVAMDGFRSDCFGTADIVIYDIDTRILYIIDFKFGRVRVSCIENPQLMIYAIAALITLEKDYPDIRQNVAMITTGVIQPKVSHAMTSWTQPIQDLMKWDAEVLLPAQNEIIYGIGTFNPGPHCGDHYCDLHMAGNCPASTKLVDDFVTDLIDNSGKERMVIEKDWSSIHRLLENEKTIIKAIEAAWKAVNEAQLDGENIPGFKLVKGKGSRKWADEEAAKKYLKGKLTKDALYKETFITAPQAEIKLKEAGKLDNTRSVNLFQAQIQYNEGKVISVLDTDTRQEVEFTSVTETIENEFDIAQPKEILAEKETSNEDLDALIAQMMA